MENEKKERATMTSDNLATLFGVSPRTIQRLTKDGILPAVSSHPYKYDPLTVVRVYVSYLQRRVEEQEKREGMQHAEFEKLRAEANIKMTQDRRARYELKQLRGNMHDGFSVDDMNADMMRVIQEEVEEIPDRVGEKWRPGQNSMQYADIIKRAAFDALNRLADYEFDPQEAERRRKRFEEREKARADLQATK